MAQGGLKKKSSKFVIPSKSRKSGNSSSKSLAPRKGKYIRPKKQARVRSEKLKKNLQKAIGQKIEQELVAAASSRDGSSFHLLHSATTSGGKKDAKGTS